jgi:hypothetical protein
MVRCCVTGPGYEKRGEYRTLFNVILEVEYVCNGHPVRKNVRLWLRAQRTAVQVLDAAAKGKWWQVDVLGSDRPLRSCTTARFGKYSMLQFSNSKQ